MCHRVHFWGLHRDLHPYNSESTTWWTNFYGSCQDKITLHGFGSLLHLGKMWFQIINMPSICCTAKYISENEEGHCSKFNVFLVQIFIRGG